MCLEFSSLFLGYVIIYAALHHFTLLWSLRRELETVKMTVHSPCVCSSWTQSWSQWSQIIPNESLAKLPETVLGVRTDTWGPIQAPLKLLQDFHSFLIGFGSGPIHKTCSESPFRTMHKKAQKRFLSCCMLLTDRDFCTYSAWLGSPTMNWEQHQRLALSRWGHEWMMLKSKTSHTNKNHKTAQHGTQLSL